MSHSVSNKINISNDDENFLKDFIILFHNNIINTDDIENFGGHNSSNWTESYLENNPQKILKIMENHEESKFWFTSLIGYFYQFGIGCKINMEKALDCYLIAINNKIDYDSLNIINENKLHFLKKKDVFNLLRNCNTIIGKYLLSLFYYKDIISSSLFEQNKFVYFLKFDENSKLGKRFNLAICVDDGYKNVFNLLYRLIEKENTSLTENEKSLPEHIKNDVQYNLAICYMDGIGTQKDEEKAFDLFLKCQPQIGKRLRDKTMISYEIEKFVKNLKPAILNDPIAQNEVGCYYYQVDTIDKKVKKCQIKAFNWFLKSANAGCADGQCNLGFCYENGIGTYKNAIKAFNLYLKSAKNGHAISQGYIGYCYQNGYGNGYKIIKDEIKAFQWYTKSAKNGDAIGQNNLGYCYDHGIGTNKNEKKAFKLYKIATESGNLAVALNNLGDCYKYGRGTDKDELKAFELYTKAARNGDAVSLNNLGDCHKYGRGTDKDELKAFKLYTKAAKNGDAVSLNNLGDCYNYGIGIDKNEEEAFELYKIAFAVHGDAVAQNNLGDCYKYGKVTVKDEKKAFNYYLKSAEKGYKMSQNNLGYCYEHGFGTGKNQQQANEWYTKAANNDDALTQNRLGRCYKYEKFISKPIRNS